jgi:hypothetical protein
MYTVTHHSKTSWVDGIQSTHLDYNKFIYDSLNNLFHLRPCLQVVYSLQAFLLKFLLSCHLRYECCVFRQKETVLVTKMLVVEYQLRRSL